MAKRFPRRPFSTKRRLKIGKERRIRIPQPDDRPIQLRQRDLVRREFVRPDAWWFILHRRGPRRPKVGEDPLEARAVSKETVPGTLPERIMYTALIRVVHLVPDADFDFQSSQEGGRVELGGIVADFLLPFLRIIIRVQGPTHSGFLRSRKDEEQRGILEEMGFRVCDITDEQVYNEYTLEDWLRRKFNLASGRGGSGGAFGPHDVEEEIGLDIYLVEKIYTELLSIEMRLDDIQQEIPLLIEKAHEGLES